MQLTPNLNFSIMPSSKFNMICSQQRRLKPMFRIYAAVMVLVWVAASWFCSEEPLFVHPKSFERDSDKTAHHQDEAVPSSTDSDHSHDSDKHDDGEHSCCDSLKATPQFASSGIFTKPDFGKPFTLNPLWLIQALTFVQPEVSVSRQPPNREWVFTPEVCLGPAFRSHAPPFAV